MFDVTFLEEAGLYREHLTNGPVTDNALRALRPNLHCYSCESERPFHLWLIDGSDRLSAPVMARGLGPAERPRQGAFHLTFKCAGCEKGLYSIFLSIHDGKVMKVGQVPRPDTQVEPSLMKSLGGAWPLFRSGLSCEMSGYGIGAFAYYRRTVEAIIENLLVRLGVILRDEDNGALLTKLESVRKDESARDRIKVASALVPQTFAFAGKNPLKVLWDVLGTDLHTAADDECLANAEVIRTVLTFLASEIANRTTAETGFRRAMKKLEAIRSATERAKKRDGESES